MTRKILTQIAGISLFGILTTGFILSDEIANIWLKYSLKRELNHLNTLSIARGRPRTRAEIDQQLHSMASKLESGRIEENTNILINVLGPEPDIHSLRLAIDLTYQKNFARHTHPCEELLEYVAEILKNNKELEKQISAGNTQIGMPAVAEFLKFARGQH